MRHWIVSVVVPGVVVGVLLAAASSAVIPFLAGIAVNVGPAAIAVPAGSLVVASVLAGVVRSRRSSRAAEAVESLPQDSLGRLERRVSPQQAPPIWLILLLALSLVAAAWVIPALLLYWIYQPEIPKQAAVIGVLLASVMVGSFYFLVNRSSFATPAERITYFGFVIPAPAGVAQILL